MLSSKSTKTIAVWFLGLVATALLSGWIYAVKTSWQNEEHLAAISTDIKSIKRSLIRISLKTDPGDPTIATELLSGTNVEQGIGHFRAGEFPAAYEAWSSAAAKGDGDAAYAIYAASETLKEKLNDPAISPAERKNVADALQSAPKVIRFDGGFVLKNKD